MSAYKPKPGAQPLPMSGLTLEHHQVILAPVISEKATHQMERRATYTFRVHVQATKPMVRAAVEHLFDVKVDDVRTQTRLGKTRKFKGRPGRTITWKKAYVTLADDNRIAMF